MLCRTVGQRKGLSPGQMGYMVRDHGCIQAPGDLTFIRLPVTADVGGSDRKGTAGALLSYLPCQRETLPALDEQSSHQS